MGTSPRDRLPQIRLQDLALRARYPGFASAVTGCCPYPGAGTRYVPQGLTWIDRRTAVLAYYDHRRLEPSLLAVLDLDERRVRAVVEVRDVKGRPWVAHAGGLTASPGHLWLAAGGRVLRVPADQLARPGGGAVRADRAFRPDSRGSCLSWDGDSLWVGEFARYPVLPGRRRYPTAAHHHHAGKRAWVAAYRLGPAGWPTAAASYPVPPGGRTALRPDVVLFVRQQVQGFAVCDHAVALSVSFSAADSRLALYDRPTDDPMRVPLPGGHETGGLVVDASRHRLTLLMPAGSQDLECRDGNLLVACEGAAGPYHRRWARRGALVDDRVFVVRPELVLRSAPQPNG